MARAPSSSSDGGLDFGCLNRGIHARCERRTHSRSSPHIRVRRIARRRRVGDDRKKIAGTEPSPPEPHQGGARPRYLSSRPTLSAIAFLAGAPHGVGKHPITGLRPHRRLALTLSWSSEDRLATIPSLLSCPQARAGELKRRPPVLDPLARWIGRHGWERLDCAPSARAHR
jgi:hypothetical protein